MIKIISLLALSLLLASCFPEPEITPCPEIVAPVKKVCEGAPTRKIKIGSDSHGNPIYHKDTYCISSRVMNGPSRLSGAGTGYKNYSNAGIVVDLQPTKSHVKVMLTDRATGDQEYEYELQNLGLAYRCIVASDKDNVRTPDLEKVCIRDRVFDTKRQRWGTLLEVFSNAGARIWFEDSGIIESIDLNTTNKTGPGRATFSFDCDQPLTSQKNCSGEY